jgi:hypothetical protein
LTMGDDQDMLNVRFQRVHYHFTIPRCQGLSVKRIFPVRLLSHKNNCRVNEERNYFRSALQDAIRYLSPDADGSIGTGFKEIGQNYCLVSLGILYLKILEQN